MERSRIDHEFYDKLLAAFRNDPGNISRASLVADCDRRTARKGWNDGWPKQGFGPMHEIVAVEQAEIRARLQEQQAKDRVEEETRLNTEEAQMVKRRDLGAKEDALVSRTEEARTVRAARHNAMGLLASVQRLMSGAHALAERVERDLKTVDMKPAQAISLFQSIASTARQANETARLAISMERTLLGEPDKIVGHVDMTKEEAIREIKMAVLVAARAESRGLPADIIDATPETPMVSVA